MASDTFADQHDEGLGVASGLRPELGDLEASGRRRDGLADYAAGYAASGTADGLGDVVVGVLVDDQRGAVGVKECGHRAAEDGDQ